MRVGVLSCGSSCTLWRGPGECSYYKIAAANFHWFPSNAFSGEIASICRKRRGGHTETPTAPHLSTPTPFCKETLMDCIERVVKWHILSVNTCLN